MKRKSVFSVLFILIHILVFQNIDALKLSEGPKLKTNVNLIENGREIASKSNYTFIGSISSITDSQTSFIQATSLTPTNGPVNSIIKLSIHGIGFSMVQKLYVHFDVTEGPYEIVPTIAVSDTLLEVETPAKLSQGETGKSVLVSVYSHPKVVLQSSNALIFRFYSIPVINIIIPNHIGMSGGTELTIFGNGLFASDDLKCLFQSKERSKIVDASYSMRTLDLKKIGIKNNNINIKTILLNYIDKNRHINEKDFKVMVTNIQNNNPIPSIVCESPSWTVPETVSLSISFNGIQYHLCTDNFVFEEESSLFGNVAHVVKERDSPSELISDEDVKVGIPQKLINFNNNSEIVIRNTNSKFTSHYHHYHQQNDNVNRYIDSSGNTYSLSNPVNASLLQSDYGLFLEFVVLLYSSFIFGTICKYIGLPLLLGYIIGGYVVGPSGFGYISQPIQIISIAQIGVCLILFTLGLEFSIKRVLSIGKSVVYCALSSLIIFVFLCSAYSVWVGTPINEGIFIGSFISMSSTAVVVGELQLESNESMLIIGVLILQDLFLGLILALVPALQSNRNNYASLSTISSKSSFPKIQDSDIRINQSKIYQIMLFFIYVSTTIWKVIKPFLILILFIAISYIVKIAIFPFILFFLLKTKNREIILVGIISLVLSISSLTEYLGLSMEMGSFVAGVILSSLLGDDEVNTFKHDFIQSAESLKWIFSMLFFTSIGLIIDATFIWDNYWTICYVCFLISIIKFTMNLLIFLICGHNFKISAHTSIMLANLGEFGFVLASKGVSLNIISRKVYLILVATTVISLLSTPVFLRIYSILLKKQLTNINLCDVNSSDFNGTRPKNLVFIGSRFSNLSRSTNLHQHNKRKVYRISNLIKNWNIFKNHSSKIHPNIYNYDIDIQNNYLNSRFHDDNTLSSRPIDFNTDTDIDFPLNENELENLSKNKNDSRIGFDTPSISLENIDEFTLAHVTNLGNSIIKR